MTQAAEHSDAAPQHMQWQQAIELHPLMAAADKQAFTETFLTLEASIFGREQLQAFAVAQKAMPAASLSEDPPSNSIDAAIQAHRQEPHKIYVYSLSEDDKTTPFGKHVIANNGLSFYPGSMVMVIDLESVTNAKLPMITPEGDKQHTPIPLVFSMAHELQHAIDYQTRLWVTKEAPLALSCAEKNGVDAENALRAEIAPAGPKRYTYIDTDITLAEISALKDDAGNIKDENKLKELRDLLTTEIHLNSGCPGISLPEAFREARMQLENLGIYIAIPAASVNMDGASNAVAHQCKPTLGGRS